MSENHYAKEAVSKLASNAAYGDAVRHLHKSGYKPEEIQELLTYPASLAQINRVIEEYENRNQSEEEYEFIQIEDRFGRRSFVRVKRNTEDE